MPGVTVAIGVLLVIQGVGFYVVTAAKSITALIPAFVGLPILVLGLIAFRKSARGLAMHLAAALALVGFLAAVGRMISSGLSVSAAGASVLILALLAGGFLVICAKSFIDAGRRPGNIEP